jgi:hypothetical protein
LTEKVEALKKAKESGNLDDIKSTMTELNTLWSTLASKMTEPSDSTGETSNPSSPPNPPKNSKGKKDEVEDADFEVVE